MDLTLSNEQQRVVTELEHKNVLVDSVAGSGKTTTILHIATKYPQFNFLLLTYNKKLKFETRQRVEQAGLTNVETHSYHSFCVKYYLRTCFTDSGIIKIVENDPTPLKNFGYDCIILDESQDLTPLYFSLVCKMYYNNSIKNSKFCILGDKNQSIYAFNKADERFIVFADKIFNINGYDWKRVKLSISFRITKPMALFVNNCMLGYENLTSLKKGNKVRYLVCNSFCSKYGGKIYDEFQMYIRMGYTHNDFFILAPSVRSERSPVRKLANYLSSKGVPIYVPNNDDEKLDEDILKNKVAFSTFHQVKGLERKVVIVFGFDDTYFQFFKKEADPLLCPNELYVATTRGKEQLTLIHHKTNGYLPFLDTRLITRICDVQGYLGEVSNNKKVSNRPKEVSVTDVTKYLPSEVIDTAVKYLNVVQVQEKSKKICIPTKSKQGDLYENVSEITGTAIPAYFEFKKTGKLSIAKNVRLVSGTPELLKLSNKWCAKKSGYNYKLMQVKNYDWLTQEELDSCITRLELYITEKSKFEVQLIYVNYEELMGMELNGFADCVDSISEHKTNLWEFKCVDKIDPEHYIQLALYAYLYQAVFNKVINYYLFNVLDNTIFKLTFETTNLVDMVKYVFNYKYGDRKVISDQEFLNNCENSCIKFNIPQK